RQQLFGGVRVALFDGGQDAGDFVHRRYPAGGKLRRNVRAPIPSSGRNRSPPGAPDRVVRPPIYSPGGDEDSTRGLPPSPRLFRTPLVIEPPPGQPTSAAGLLPLRQFDEQTGLTRAFAEALDDPRDPALTEHTFLEMVRSRVYGTLAGSADQNDHA